jgi:hypothetical protein
MKKDLAFHAEKMRYQKNGLSYGLILLSILFSLVATFSLITYDSFTQVAGALRVVPDMRIGLEIFITIIAFMVTFLAAEKIKCYNPVWSFGVIYTLAALNLWRMSSFPAYVFGVRGWVPYEVALRGMIEFGVSGGLLILAGVIATIKVIIIRKYTKVTTH